MTVALVLCLLTMLLSGCQTIALDYGGTVTIDLDPGEKLMEITWNDESDLWYLTRPMRDDETAEKYEFKQSREWKIAEGKVIVIEHEKKEVTSNERIQ